MTYYTVNLTMLSVQTFEVIREEHITFKSLRAAICMAKLYSKHTNVGDVNVIDNLTGEVMYYHTADKEYEAEL